MTENNYHFSKLFLLLECFLEVSGKYLTIVKCTVIYRYKFIYYTGLEILYRLVCLHLVKFAKEKKSNKIIDLKNAYSLQIAIPELLPWYV